MNKEEIKNAFIKDIDVVRHNDFLTLSIEIEGFDWRINYGGVALDEYNADLKERVGTAYASQVIIDLIQAFEVHSLFALKGKPIRVKFNIKNDVIEIGHYIKDYDKNWFSYRKTLNKVKESE